VDLTGLSGAGCWQVSERGVWRLQSIRQKFTVCQRGTLTESEDVMKLKLGMTWVWLGCLAVVCPLRAAETNAAAGRVGVYDSRVVAYAWFWSDAQQTKLKEQMAAAKAAKQAGDEAKSKEYSNALRALQDQMHREVFSIAPADEALTVIKGRIPEIEKAAGVPELVSKWDKPSLNKYKDAEKVDVTDNLVRAFFNPTDKQVKVIEGIKKSDPLPLEQCNELIRKRKI
jgi:hypothetical protein